MKDKVIGEGITFDDILLVPARSSVSPKEIDTSTRLTRNIALHIPFASAPMDTVTESALAIALAQEGGLGIVHRNLPVEAQALEVEKVKRSANGIIPDPITLPPNESTAKARKTMADHNVSGIPIIADGKKLVGILTRRDMKFLSADTTIENVMSAENLIASLSDDNLLSDAG